MVFKRMPFEANSAAEMIKKIKCEELTFREEYWENTSLELQDLIDQQLSKRPGLRLTASEILKHPWIQNFAK